MDFDKFEEIILKIMIAILIPIFFGLIIALFYFLGMPFMNT